MRKQRFVLTQATLGANLSENKMRLVFAGNGVILVSSSRHRYRVGGRTILL